MAEVQEHLLCWIHPGSMHQILYETKNVFLMTAGESKCSAGNSTGLWGIVLAVGQMPIGNNRVHQIRVGKSKSIDPIKPKFKNSIARKATW